MRQFIARLVALLFLAGCGSAMAEGPTIDSRYAQLQEFIRSGDTASSAFALELANHYRVLFPSTGIAHIVADARAEDLDLFFRATYEVVAYTGRREFVPDLDAAYGALGALGALKDFHRADLYSSLVRVRMFERARIMYEREPLTNVEPPPLFQDNATGAPGPTVLVVHARERRVERVDLPTIAGPHVIVVSHPLCGYSRAAAEAIEADETIRSLFHGRSRWIAPPDGNLRLGTLQAWNKGHDGAQVMVAFAQDEWPLIDTWATPTFYFVRDGAVVQKIAGWNGAESKAELLHAFSKLMDLEG